MVSKSTAKAASIAALAFTMIGVADAQSVVPAGAPVLSFNSSSNKETWHMVLLISAGVGILGLVNSDSTLTILGGAGVLLSLYESQGSHFQVRPSLRGVDMFKSGPMSFGLNPFGGMGAREGFSLTRPAAYVKLSFKF